MKVPLSKPFVNDEMAEAIVRVLKSEKYILGDECRAFEEEFAAYVGVKHGVLTNSGTSGLLLSLMALGVWEGDEILVPSHTAFPTIEPIMHLGAKPVFVDIKEDGFTIDNKDLERKITDKTKVVIPVHIYGEPADMNGSFFSVIGDRKLFVLEDACQAHGASYKRESVGSIGDAGVFSFYPSKNMTVGGDGGIVVTHNSDIADKVRMLRDHGRRGRYEHELVGHNMRFNEMQAAIGRIQLRHLNDFVRRRREIAKRYRDGLRESSLKLPLGSQEKYHSYHMFVIMTEGRDNLKQKLDEAGVGTQVHYPIPTHRQPGTKRYFDSKGWKINEGLERTDYIVDRILSLPIFPEITNEQVDYVIEKIKENL